MRRTLGGSERARGALERKQGRRALSVEVRDTSFPPPPLEFIDPWEPRSLNRAPRTLTTSDNTHH
jgi:hypothetical protein